MIAGHCNCDRLVTTGVLLVNKRFLMRIPSSFTYTDIPTMYLLDRLDNSHTFIRAVQTSVFFAGTIIIMIRVNGLVVVSS